VTVKSGTTLGLDLATGTSPVQRAFLTGPVTSQNLVFTYTIGFGASTNDLTYSSENALSLLSGSAVIDSQGAVLRFGLPIPSSAQSLSGTSQIEIGSVRLSVATIPFGGRNFNAFTYVDGYVVLWGGRDTSYSVRSEGVITDFINAPVTFAEPTPLNAGSFGGRYGMAAVAAGSKMLMWGGSVTSNEYRRVASFTPANQTFSVAENIDSPAGVNITAGVWTGTKLIVWGGDNAATGGIYDPSDITWQPISPFYEDNIGSAEGRSEHKVSYDQNLGKLLVFGGGYGEFVCQQGEVYTVATDRWKSMGTFNKPLGRCHQTQVWTGSKLIIWGGRAPSTGIDAFADGGIYDPASDTWTTIPTDPSIPGRWSAAGAWDDISQRMIVFGGLGADGLPLTTVLAFNPIDLTWTTLPLNDGSLTAGESRDAASGGGAVYFHGTNSTSIVKLEITNLEN
jgi:hypothetical protein